MQWNYNKILATAKAVKVYKEGGYNKNGGKIRVILNPDVCYPRSSAKHDVEAAEKFDSFFNIDYIFKVVK